MSLEVSCSGGDSVFLVLPAYGFCSEAGNCLAQWSVARCTVHNSWVFICELMLQFSLPLLAVITYYYSPTHIISIFCNTNRLTLIYFAFLSAVRVNISSEGIQILACVYIDMCLVLSEERRFFHISLCLCQQLSVFIASKGIHICLHYLASRETNRKFIDILVNL